jgi:hypothetical protein
MNFEQAATNMMITQTVQNQEGLRNDRLGVYSPMRVALYLQKSCSALHFRRYELFKCEYRCPIVETPAP